MGIKGELGGGFPQPKPAFSMTVEWDVAHSLGPTTHPKNHLSYLKIRGTVKSAHDSNFPPFEAEFVDGGAWVQEELLHSGQPWIKPEGFALLRVVEPPNTLTDPETETGLVRLTWSGVGSLPNTLKPAFEKDLPQLIRAMPTEDEPGATVNTYKFQTGDQRYKYLEHAVYIGNSRIMIVPAEDRQDGHKAIYDMKVCYLAA